MTLSCGCRPVFVADRNVRTPVPAGKGHAGFKYADVCPARTEVQAALAC
jgi:hypothetical protein